MIETENVYTYYLNPSKEEVLGHVCYLDNSDRPEYRPREQPAYSFYQIPLLKNPGQKPVVIFQNERSADLGLIHLSSIIALATCGGATGLGSQGQRFFITPESVRILKRLTLYIFPEFYHESYQWALQLQTILLARYALGSKILDARLCYQLNHQQGCIDLEYLINLGLNDARLQKAIKPMEWHDADMSPVASLKRTLSESVSQALSKEEPVVHASPVIEAPQASQSDLWGVVPEGVDSGMQNIQKLHHKLYEAASRSQDLNDRSLEAFKELISKKDIRIVAKMIEAIELFDPLKKISTASRFIEEPDFFERCYNKFSSNVTKEVAATVLVTLDPTQKDPAPMPEMQWMHEPRPQRPSKQKHFSAQENIAWYRALPNHDKQTYFKQACFQYPLLENMVGETDISSDVFLKSHCFDILMELLGRKAP